jgi:hypothetical protein
MTTTDLISRIASTGMSLVRGRVDRVEPEGSVVVEVDDSAGNTPARSRCLVLLPPDGSPASLDHGQLVLVALDGRRREGIVLGVIGNAVAVSTEPEPKGVAAVDAPAVESRIVLKAANELVLEVGETSIRITHDGRIVLRGENILQRAKGTLRLKGGSVAIN